MCKFRFQHVACFAVVVLVAAATTAVQAQPTFSIDFQGPTAGLVLEGDILTPVGAGMVAPPAVVIPAGAAGLGVGPTAPGFIEVDALSYGRDPMLPNQAADPGDFIQHNWFFSVDEFAVGIPGVPFPSVTTEGAGGPIGEASADDYLTPTVAPPVFVPPFAPGFNVGVIDGNGGATPFAAPGLNLMEPNPPGPGSPFDPGDNQDALDIDTPVLPPAGTFPVFFSLDTAKADPIEGPPANTGTAAANGFVGGDVLITAAAGGVPALYAAAPLLGLDQFGISDDDDLDALVLWDNGDFAYQPTTGPYSWLGGTDMLLYSVRRGSGVIGAIDMLQGLPIEEGDILVPVATAGGAFFPGIFVAAEALGLATVRSGLATFQSGFGDELDALDVQFEVVPEPSTVVLLAIGVVLFALRRRGH